MQPLSDDDLDAFMRAANAGDQTAYRRVLERLAMRLHGYVRGELMRAGRGAEEAEDVLQEILLAVHLKRDTWDPRRPLAPWAYAIARYKIVDHLRKPSLAGYVGLDAIADTLPSQSARETADLLDRRSLLAGLPERQRQIVEAMSVHGLSAREVGIQFDMSEGAVRVALHRALKAMAQRARGGGA